MVSSVMCGDVMVIYHIIKAISYLLLRFFFHFQRPSKFWMLAFLACLDTVKDWILAFLACLNTSKVLDTCVLACLNTFKVLDPCVLAILIYHQNVGFLKSTHPVMTFHYVL